LKSQDTKLEAKCNYNLGNCAFRECERQKDSDLKKSVEACKQAIGFYKNALRLNPEMAEAARNLEVARLTMKAMLDEIKNREEAEKKAGKILKSYTRFANQGLMIPMIEDGITPDIIREKMKGYDLLIMGITEKIDENLKSIMKTHYKPIFLIPSKSEYKFENIIFADDNGENSNKSIFKFMNCFENIENYKFISVNIENKSENLKKYMEIAGKKVEITDKKGDETEIIISESEEMDILIMGNLKHFFIYEKLTGKVGLKLLQNSKIPIFIG